MHFDFQEVLRISEVWEGSNEDLFSMGTVWWDHPAALKKEFGKDVDSHISNFMEVHRNDNILPIFKYLTSALYSEDYTPDGNIFNHQDIKLVSFHDYYNSIAENFWYLTEEPSHIKEFLKSHKKTTTNWDFIREIDNPQSTNELVGQLSLFLGKALEAYLSYHCLQQNPDMKIQDIKITRNKI